VKNFTIILSWPPDLWIDICPACLEKKIPGTQVLSGDHSIVNVRDIENSIGELQRELEEEDD
jgi:hypothetical protein